MQRYSYCNKDPETYFPETEQYMAKWREPSKGF